MRRGPGEAHARAMTSTTTTPIAVIQDVYAAFGRGDIPGLLAHVADECDWSDRPDVAGADAVPMFRNLRTPADVAEQYFGGFGSTAELHEFVPRVFACDGDDVLVVLKIAYTVVATGRRFDSEEVHHFTLDGDGRIVRYRPHLDTARLIWCYGGAS